MYIPIVEMLDKTELTHKALNIIFEIGIKMGNSTVLSTPNMEFAPVLQRLRKMATRDSVAMLNKLCMLKLSKQRIVDITNGGKGTTNEEFMASGFRDKIEDLYKYNRPVSIWFLKDAINGCTGYKMREDENPLEIIKQFLECSDKKILQIKDLVTQYQSLVNKPYINKTILGGYCLASFGSILPIDSKMLLLIFLVAKIVLNNKNNIVHYSSFEEMVGNSYEEFTHLSQNIKEQKKNAVPEWIEYILSQLKNLYDNFNKQLHKNNTKRDIKSLTALQELQKIATNDPFSINSLVSKNRLVSREIWMNVVHSLMEKNKIERVNSKDKNLYYRKASINIPSSLPSSHRSISGTQKGSKTQRIREVIRGMDTPFTFNDMRKQCCMEGINGASEVTVRKTLDLCKNEGWIVCKKQGRSSYWHKTQPSE